MTVPMSCFIATSRRSLVKATQRVVARQSRSSNFLPEVRWVVLRDSTRRQADHCWPI
jgi:hypothetical protein